MYYIAITARRERSVRGLFDQLEEAVRVTSSSLRAHWLPSVETVRQVSLTRERDQPRRLESLLGGGKEMAGQPAVARHCRVHREMVQRPTVCYITVCVLI